MIQSSQHSSFNLRTGTGNHKVWEMFNRRIISKWVPFILTAAVMSSECSLRAAAGVAESIQAIRAVGLEGKGQTEAGQAMRILTTGGATNIPAILMAMGAGNDLAANWLRSAVETIAQRELTNGGRLPLLELGQFVLETSNPPRARRLAFELITRADPSTADRLLNGMVNDPSTELRRDAVQKIIRQADTSLAESNKIGATLIFQQLLTLARDVDQVDAIAKNLRTLGQTVDLPWTLGFLTQWKVVGPFDSTGGKGFAAVYKPEEILDLSAEYDGKSGKVRWQTLATTDEDGSASMNKPFTALKGAAAFAYTEFYADHAQTAELRLGSKNAFKVWLNGKFLFGQDEYHRNKAIDQYRMTGQFQSGRNIILVKVCQNEQTEDWASEWDFQLRVCDSLGTPLRSATIAQVGAAPISVGKP